MVFQPQNQLCALAVQALNGRLQEHTNRDEFKNFVEGIGGKNSAGFEGGINTATHTLARLMKIFPYGSHIYQDPPSEIAYQIRNGGQNLLMI